MRCIMPQANASGPGFTPPPLPAMVPAALLCPSATRLAACHPLPASPQVVELPRQKPDAALQLFAPVAAHVRILVIGGDGSGEWASNRCGHLGRELEAVLLLRCCLCACPGDARGPPAASRRC